MAEINFHTARLTTVGRHALRAGAVPWWLALRLGLATRRCAPGCTDRH